MMVVSRGDIKRKRKDDGCINLLDDSPKRTKVHAQRKFAQGSNVSSPVITPVKEIERQERSNVLPEPTELLPIKRPNTEDFLTFLCFRGTPILPPNLNFFNTASMINTQIQSNEPKSTSPKNGPIVTTTTKQNTNERPFIAFGVRKRTDPIIISKQMDKKRRHALTLQALRRKYQEQKMAKIRAVTISKLSEKVTSKSVVRTRSVTKNETVTKKNITQKTKIKVVATKRVTTRTTMKQPVRANIKSKMCLRSFRGRYIHHELSIRSHKKKSLPKNYINRKRVTKEAGATSSEFSSDDDEPLVKTAKIKSNKRIVPKVTKKSVSGPKKPKEENFRLTRSNHRILNNQLSPRKQALQRKRFFTKTSSNIRTASSKIKRKIIKSSRINKNNDKNLENKIPLKKQNLLEKKVTRAIKKNEQQVPSNKIKSVLRKTEMKKMIREKNVKCESENSKSKKEEIKKQYFTEEKVTEKDEEKNGKIDKKEEKKIVKEKSTKIEVQVTKKEENKKHLKTKEKIVEKKEDAKKEDLKKVGKLQQEKNLQENCNVTVEKDTETIKKEKFELKKSDKVTKSNESQNKTERKSEEMSISSSRPTRKTKEAAAIYMEILGHKLVNDTEIDDDDVSIDSFPELPNVRKTEQRENELKAKVKSKTYKTKNTAKKMQFLNVNSDTKKDSELSTENSEQIDNNTEQRKAKIIDELKFKMKSDEKMIDIETNTTTDEKQEISSKRKPNQNDVNSLPITQNKIPRVQDELCNTSIKSEMDKRRTRNQDSKPMLNFSDSDDSFSLAAIGKAQFQKKINISEILESKPNVILSDIKNEQINEKVSSDNVKEKTVNLKVLKSTEGDLLKLDKPLNKKNEKLIKKTKILKTKVDVIEPDFSDSDEEPLAKLTKSKAKIITETSTKSKSLKYNKKIENRQNIDTKAQYKGKLKGKSLETFPAEKPKRECTKKPQNYLPLFSSSDDEDKYFHGFVKTESKIKEKKGEEKCVHSLASTDLLCKDISLRFGKGKVNMSNEQIEKWLNDSALAGINIKKENDQMLKFGEKIPCEISLEPTLDCNKLKTYDCKETIKDKEIEETCSTSFNSTPEKQILEKPTIKPILNERKTIFRKERSEPKRNINAFSVSNESSVYAFEADNEDSVNTPFRRPSRRPSSTTTSKSEDEISKMDDISKTCGKFRLPKLIKPDFKSPNKNDPATILDSLNSNSIAVQVNLESGNFGSNTEMQASSNERLLYIPLQKNKHSQIINVNDKSKLAGKDTKSATQMSVCIEKMDDKPLSMFPPANTLQKSKNDKVNKIATNKQVDRTSETSEDFKYKIPNSPSASSSSSAKLYKRHVTKTRNRPLEFCTSVNVTEFPSPHTFTQMVEAPVFHPSEKEFQDPIEYIEKIRPKAEKFGICRIVPPSNFKPECKVSDDMRFTAYNQYVHKMLHRWGPNFKELMAIRKYLQTQNITLTHPPWIGGMEIDLPRLYQTVQSLGGLKEVIEKKKWAKVSEVMKIPKSAQDRVTKLDDIYCKYLLPYDTLSPAEREKLFDEVETEWAKRESKTLLKVQQKVNKSESTSNASDSDSDDESEECIVKGRNMALNAFYRIARNTMSMWFKTVEPPPQEVELEFWKHVTLRSNHICVHSGSIDSGNWGYGFAVTKNSPFARHVWNLKVLTNNSGSVLRSMGPLMGVTVPTLHVGMVFSACCWYRDPHSLPWIEYLHTGANKIWYAIPDSMSEHFHNTLLKLVPNYCRNKSLWLPSDTVMIPPNLLVENGVSLCRTVQAPGQYIVVFPKVFTSSISTGYVVSESVYFAPPYWLQTAHKVFDELRNSCEPSMFSIDRLILSISSDPRSNIDVLKQIIPAVEALCDREKKLRSKLVELGLSSTEKLPLPETPAVRKRKKLQDDNGDYECEICRTNLFTSMVTESQDDAVYCLEHTIEHLENEKIQINCCKLLYTYDDSELDKLVEKIKCTIEFKLQKKIPGKYGNMPTLLK